MTWLKTVSKDTLRNKNEISKNGYPANRGQRSYYNHLNADISL